MWFISTAAVSLTVITAHQVGCGRAIEVVLEKSIICKVATYDGCQHFGRMQNLKMFWRVESGIAALSQVRYFLFVLCVASLVTVFTWTVFSINLLESTSLVV